MQAPLSNEEWLSQKISQAHINSNLSETGKWERFHKLIEDVGKGTLDYQNQILSIRRDKTKDQQRQIT